MYRFCPIVLKLFVLVATVFPILSDAAVIVTPCSGVCLNNAPGGYNAIGNITIRESLASDISSQSGVTLILSAPAGFEFQAGIGIVSYQSGRNISAASLVTTSTTITVTYSCTGTNKADRLVISGLRARGTSPGSAAFILRTGGTANMSGNATSDGVIHGRLSSDGTGVTAISISNGNWSSTSTWSTGVVPNCNQEVIINHTVTADIPSNNNNLIINTGGNLIASFPISVSDTLKITGTGTYTHNNNDDEASTIFAGVEEFSSTSNLIINQWSDLSIPLATNVSGTLGNITFNIASTWQQNGLFSPAKIAGNIIVNAGTLIMDDGTGMTTSLTLQDVTLNGGADIRMCSGAGRNFTLNTGNFSDLGTGSTPSTIMYMCTGTLVWNATGDVTLNDQFTVVENSGSPPSVNISITGDLNITGGDTKILNLTSTSLNMSVGGTTAITGTPTVILTTSGSGAVIFNTGNLEVSTGTSISLLSGTFSGTNQFTIAGNMEISGAGTTFRFVNPPVYTNVLNVAVGIDIIITDADVYFVNSNGGVNISCGRHFTVSGTSTELYLQERLTNSSNINLTVSGTHSITDSYYKMTQGDGFVNLVVGEAFILDGATFYGVVKNTAPSTSTGSFTFEDFSFFGGFAQFVDVKTNGPTTININCLNNFDINWSSNSDIIILNEHKGTNEAALNFNVGGNFTVSGNYPSAKFLSSHATKDENVVIIGSFSVSGGQVYFVSDQLTLGTNGHNITMSIGEDINISGGTTFLSCKSGTATFTVGGDLIISNGILNQKWNSGSSVMTISGGYQQSGGTFNMHSNTGGSSDTIKVIVYGDFLQSGGTLNFDNATGSGLPDNTLTFYGANYTLSGSGVITHANNLSGSTSFGQIYFNRAGTVTYNRNTSTHEIQHVKQTISSATTVNASASTNGFQMTSVSSSVATVYNSLTINGILDMGAQILSARQYASYYSMFSINSNARYRTSHTGGFYSGSNAIASSINGYILTNNRVNYYLASTSVVEYYGTNISKVTGVPNGIATGASHQYGILDINFTGTAGSAWVYPETDNEVRIRNSLRLTAGEFNLDSDHTTAGGGRSINIEAGATITRTAGFIRSETEDGSGVVKWNITANSSNIFPFGYDAANYIPFTYQQTSGTSGIVQVGTYRTLPNNSPLPPTVTHVRDVYGVDNSASTVDRFWNITVPGTAVATMTYTYVASEGTGIVSPRAQRWEPVTMGWYPPSGVQSNPTATSTTAGTITAFNTWWTLSALNSPLPVELGVFEVSKNDDKAMINWKTYTEINNDFFTVLKSSNGTDFNAIEIVQGAGNTNSTVNYKTTDSHPYIGLNYYKLKQTDYDGMSSYSEVRTVYFGKTRVVSVYPNPITSGEDINIRIPDKGVYHITISDLSGRILMSTIMDSIDSDMLQITPSQNQLQAGIYSIVITGTSTSYSQKLVVTK